MHLTDNQLINHSFGSSSQSINVDTTNDPSLTLAAFDEIQRLESNSQEPASIANEAALLNIEHHAARAGLSWSDDEHKILVDAFTQYVHDSLPKMVEIGAIKDTDMLLKVLAEQIVVCDKKIHRAQSAVLKRLRMFQTDEAIPSGTNVPTWRKQGMDIFLRGQSIIHSKFPPKKNKHSVSFGTVQPSMNQPVIVQAISPSSRSNNLVNSMTSCTQSVSQSSSTFVRPLSTVFKSSHSSIGSTETRDSITIDDDTSGTDFDAPPERSDTQHSRVDDTRSHAVSFSGIPSNNQTSVDQAQTHVNFATSQSISSNNVPATLNRSTANPGIPSEDATNKRAAVHKKRSAYAAGLTETDGAIKSLVNSISNMANQPIRVETVSNNQANITAMKVKLVDNANHLMVKMWMQDCAYAEKNGLPRPEKPQLKFNVD